MDTVALEIEDQIGTLTLNRPEKLNALSPGMLDDFSEAIELAAADDRIKVIVIRGAGRAFCTGYDLAASPSATVDVDRWRLQRNVERWLALREIPKPVIAMVHGYCLAGATQLCICCDVIFVAEDASVGFPSLPAGAGYVSAMWNWMVGPHRTKYMAFLPGSRITGKEAMEMGFATRVFPADALVEETYRYARQISKVPAEKLALDKLSLNRAMDYQGFRAASLSGAEYDAIFHFGSGNAEIKQIRKDKGHKGAIAWYESQ